MSFENATGSSLPLTVTAKLGIAEGREMRVLARDGVHAFSVATFGGLDLQSHILAERSRKEAAHGVGLPACGFHQFGQGRALGLFQEGDDVGPLLPWPGVEALALGRRFGAVLPRRGFRVDLAFVVAARGFRVAARALPDSAGSEATVG